jgi:hypothetical protein
LLDRLHEGRLVTRMTVVTGEPGRPPWGYWLGEEQIPGAERAVNTPQELLDSGPTDESGGAAEDGDSEASARQDADGGAAPVPSEYEIPPEYGSHEPQQATAGQLVRGYELVLVDVSGSGLSDLLEALAGTRTADRAIWTVRIGNELTFAFDGSGTRSDAGDLLAVLAGARLPVRHATVGRVAPAHELIDQARRIAPEIRRARSERDAHNAPH